MCRALGSAGYSQAVLSHPETLACLGCFEAPLEDWPVSNPFVAVPALLCLGPSEAVLVVADFHLGDVRECGARVVSYRSYDFQSPPDPAGELRTALIGALDDAGVAHGQTGVEAMNLPNEIADWLRQAGRTPVACDAVVASARGVRSDQSSVPSGVPAGSQMSFSRPSRISRHRA